MQDLTGNLIDFGAVYWDNAQDVETNLKGGLREKSIAKGDEMARNAARHEAAWLAAIGETIDPVLPIATDAPSLGNSHTGVQRALGGDEFAPTVDTATGSDTRTSVSSEPSDSTGDSVMCPDLLGLMCATPKQAEMADRARGAALGLDARHRAPKTLRKTAASRAAAIRAKRRIKTVGIETNPPRFSAWRPRVAPHAHTDGGNGVLSIVDSQTAKKNIALTSGITGFRNVVAELDITSGGTHGKKVNKWLRFTSDITG